MHVLKPVSKVMVFGGGALDVGWIDHTHRKWFISGPLKASVGKVVVSRVRVLLYCIFRQHSHFNLKDYFGLRKNQLQYIRR